jgi:DNA-binding LytR/AlgR family response regulator
MPLVIFIAAYTQYAVQALEIRAIDYLLKPFGQQRFDEALDRVMQRLAPPPNAVLGVIPSLGQKTEYLERIPIHHRGRVSFAVACDVDWIEAGKNHALFTSDTRLQLCEELYVVGTTPQS